MTACTARPQRYRADRLISAAVDILQDREDLLRGQGDDENARRLTTARGLVVDIALGVPEQEHQEDGRRHD